MKIIDESPGAFIVLAAIVVYSVVGVEIWMWMVASTAAVATTLALVLVCAVLICRALAQLADEGVSPAPTAVAEQAAAPTPIESHVAVPAPPRRAAVRPAGPHAA